MSLLTVTLEYLPSSKPKGLAAILLFFLLPFVSNSQDYPYEVRQHDFIKYDENHLDFFGDSLGFEVLYEKIDRLMFQGDGQINIVHIGGSHIQADIFSDQMRQRFGAFFPGNAGGRGFLFPYNVAKTNNPYNYETTYNGSWTNCRNVQKTKDCTLGLAGISVTTTDTVSSIELGFRGTSSNFDFNRIRVFHDIGKSSFSIIPVSPGSSPSITVDSVLGFTQFDLENFSNHFEFQFKKTDSIQDHFTLYGFDLGSDEPGFYYDAIGVNGASVPSYLRCQLFVPHLQSIQPDLVVLSIGINDAYKTDFSGDEYESNYDSLIAMIKSAAPNTAILFTTNNDSYYKRRYPNRNAFEVVKRMQKLSKKHDAGIWDMFEIMGGLNSVIKWQRKGLAKKDKIHFTPDGYRLVGDLMFNAFMKSFDRYFISKYGGDK